MTDPITRAAKVAEQQIREAMEAGEFDNLPGAGKPIPDDNRPYDPGWWSRRYANRMREEERREERIRELALAIDRCWLLPEQDAVESFAAIKAEWGTLYAVDRTLPPPPTEAEFRATWGQMYRARRKST